MSTGWMNRRHLLPISSSGSRLQQSNCCEITAPPPTAGRLQLPSCHPRRFSDFCTLPLSSEQYSQIFANMHEPAHQRERLNTHIITNIFVHTHIYKTFLEAAISKFPLIFDSKNYGLSPFKYCLLTAVDTFNFQLKNWQLD